VVAGDRVGRSSGFTLCGAARDAGCRLPMLFLTGEDCRWTAVRAARLQITVLWQPVPTCWISQALIAMLPRRPCTAAGSVKLPAWPQAAGETASATPTALAGRPMETDRWHRSRSVW
jgi:hypothetical protein